MNDTPGSRALSGCNGAESCTHARSRTGFKDSLGDSPVCVAAGCVRKLIRYKISRESSTDFGQLHSVSKSLHPFSDSYQ